MKKMFLNLGLLLTFGLTSVVFSSCSDENINTTSVPEQNPNVYVAGCAHMDGKAYITLWKNGVAQHLSDGITNNIYISSAFISNNGDVYVTGQESIGGVYFNTLWKNGTPERFGEGGNQTSSVSVSGNDVYFLDGQKKLWKNSVEQNLNLAENDCLFDVYAVGNKVYSVGWKFKKEQYYPYNQHLNRLYQEVVNASLEITSSNVATIWTEDGQAQYLTDGIDEIIEEYIEEYIDSWIEKGKRGYIDTKVSYTPTPTCVYVSDNKVYVAATIYFGVGDYATLLWENGKVKYRLEGGGVPCSIFVSGNDVYVAGDKQGNIRNSAILWKNGKVIYHFTEETNGFSNRARSVYVSGNDVYVVGTEGGKGGMLWKNGVAQPFKGDPYFVLVK